MLTRRTSLASASGLESIVLFAFAIGCSSSSSPTSSPGLGGGNNISTGGSATTNATGGSGVSATHTGGAAVANTGGTTSNVQTGGAPAATGGAVATPTGGAAAIPTGGAPTSATGGTDSQGVGGTNSGTTGGSSNTSAGGAETGGASATVVQKDCANMKALTSATLTDFESYDGTTDPAKWSFPFNGVWPAAIYGGPYPNSDGTGAFVLGFVGGANNSTWAIHAANTTQASAWGGGVGFWLGCFDASSYSGLSFYARGTTPTSKISVSIAMEDTSPPSATNPAGGGTCTITPTSGCKPPSFDVALPADWTLVKIPWASFTGGMGMAGTAVTANGARITGLNFGAVMVWQDAAGTGTWTPVPAPFDIQIDNIGFY